MKIVTWRPGQNIKLDKLFDDLREQQYKDRTHRLWKNYDKDFYNYTVALTIYFDDNGVPELCSSISNRSCWPNSAFRILNRAWKPNHKKSFLRQISDCMGYSVIDQIKWLKFNTKCDLYFISRQTDKWNDWVAKKFESQFKIFFKTDNYKYLTCPNKCDNSCWQRIIYNGNEELLKSWDRK